MTPRSDSASRKLALNRKAFRDYAVLDRIETGIELRGTEVKALRAGSASLSGSYAAIEDGELILHGFNIPAYEHGNRFNHESSRPRRLLAHRKEIVRLAVHTDQKGHALVPLSAYWKKGRVKIEIGACRGKSHVDKRETMKRKTADRETQRALAGRNRA